MTANGGIVGLNNRVKGRLEGRDIRVLGLLLVATIQDTSCRVQIVL